MINCEAPDTQQVLFGVGEAAAHDAGGREPRTSDNVAHPAVGVSERVAEAAGREPFFPERIERPSHVILGNRMWNRVKFNVLMAV